MSADDEERRDADGRRLGTDRRWSRHPPPDGEERRDHEERRGDEDRREPARKRGLRDALRELFSGWR